MRPLARRLFALLATLAAVGCAPPTEDDESAEQSGAATDGPRPERVKAGIYDQAPGSGIVYVWQTTRGLFGELDGVVGCRGAMDEAGGKASLRAEWTIAGESGRCDLQLAPKGTELTVRGTVVRKGTSSTLDMRLRPRPKDALAGRYRKVVDSAMANELEIHASSEGRISLTVTTPGGVVNGEAVSPKLERMRSSTSEEKDLGIGTAYEIPLLGACRATVRVVRATRGDGYGVLVLPFNEACATGGRFSYFEQELRR